MARGFSIPIMYKYEPLIKLNVIRDHNSLDYKMYYFGGKVLSV